MTLKENAQARGCVNSTRSEFREQCEENTIAGVNECVANREHDDCLGDHDAHVTDSIVKSNELYLFFLRQRA